MYSCILIIIIIIFLMSTNSFFFSSLIAPMGGCPSPWACGAYPKAGMRILLCFMLSLY